MSNFATNQSHQLYVVIPGTNGGYQTTVTSTSPAGTIGGILGGSSAPIEDLAQGNQVMFKYKGVESVMHSDLIPIKNISYAKAIPASQMITVMKKVEVTLDSTVNDGEPVKGQDYVLGINFRNFFSSGDASQYFKDAAVHATDGMTASDFYKAMVNSLNSAFSREPGATKTSNPYLKFSWKPNATTATTADAIVIEELPQDWALGTKKARRIMFDVVSTTIYTAGEDLVWGTVTDATPAKANAVVGTNAVGNGQQIADLEWFCMGERGDQYRKVGWPNYIPTKYLVDPTKQYHVLEIHYAFTDTGVNSYRTEKEITIVSESAVELNKFITPFSQATGLQITPLPTT